MVAMLQFAEEGVEAAREALRMAETSDVRRFVLLSPLVPNREVRAAEELVRGSRLPWTIVRCASVYGPGDPVVAALLKMVRTLPAVPIAGGDRPFQPIWHADLIAALNAIPERDDLARKVIHLAGEESTSLNELFEKLVQITGRKPLRIPAPARLAPVEVEADDVLPDGEPNGLTSILRIVPTPLDEALRILADSLRENLPEEGVGALHHKTLHAVIHGSEHDALDLMLLFRERILDVMPIDFAAEPGAQVRVELGATLTAALPLRGHIQVRVEEVTPTRVVLGTVEGHPLAGIVEFSARDVVDGVRFAIDIYVRAANVVDFVALRTIGIPAQWANWRSVVQRMIDLSGGTSDGVHSVSEKLHGEEAAAVEERVREMIQRRENACLSALRAAQ